MDIESSDDIQTEIEYIIFNLSIWNYLFKLKRILSRGIYIIFRRARYNLSPFNCYSQKI